MTQTKRIVVLHVDGTETVLPTPPTWSEMQALVDGYVKHVRVLEIDEEGMKYFAYRYTAMFVNEEGLLRDLPRNARATEAYQRNVRTQYPHSAQPFREARANFEDAVRAQGYAVIEQAEPAPGYLDDPWIAGEAVLFEGWTCEEVHAYYNHDDEEEDPQ